LVNILAKVLHNSVLDLVDAMIRNFMFLVCLINQNKIIREQIIYNKRISYLKLVNFLAKVLHNSVLDLVDAMIRNFMFLVCLKNAKYVILVQIISNKRISYLKLVNVLAKVLHNSFLDLVDAMIRNFMFLVS